MAIPIPEILQEYALNLVTKYVTKQLDYVWNYKKRVTELETVVNKLKNERDRVRDKAEEDEDRYGREVFDYVKEWLDQADKIISEYENFKEHSNHAGCPLPFPNLKQRYGRSKKAEEIKETVGELQKENYDNISRWHGPFSMGVAFSNVDYESFESRTETMKKIMEALGDPSARMIGVHGLAGVGKTTLVIEAARKAQEHKLFNVVIMANVTKSPDIRKIQGQIADMLGMKLEEESEYARAVRIQERLKKEKENTLIVLDDLYAKVDLNVLGIPSQIGDGSQKNLLLKEGKSFAPVAHDKMATKQIPGLGAMKTENTSGGSSKSKTEESHKTCKILLISEVRQVLSQMDVKASLSFSVDVLNDKDAETLFKKMAGISAKSSEFKDLAVEIAKRCYGLPMSIVTTARALKNQSHSVWDDNLRKLERQKLTGTPEYSTKLSYDLLENDELKITFLLCARMGHDALVTDLVKYCIGLGFLQGIYTVREAKDRVQASLVNLKESGLLSNSYSSDRFTMQNLVRNVAMSIAAEEYHVLTLTEEKLDEWPDEDKLERYTVISLQYCDVIEEFPEKIRCPSLRVFHVNNNDPCLKVPDNFFQEMKELRVLILTGIHLSPLPSSIRCLTKLRMLCLEQCKLGEQLRIIGELKNLRILSFSGSDIESLPVELKHLSKLQIFDISNCFKLKIIPPNVISSLTSLEELYMRNTSIQWSGVEGQKSRSENASLSELRHLNQLTNLDLQIPSVAHLPKNLFFDKLYSYKIVIGSSDRYLEPDFKTPDKFDLLRFLAIREKDGFDIHSQKGIKMLFERVEILLLEKLNGVQDIFYALNLKGFPCLKHLSIANNSAIQSLINPKERKHPERAFPKLESLNLYKLNNMKELCSSSCKLSAASFGKLKIIKINLCDQLKNVFLISMATLLTTLEAIEVSECNSLEEIVLGETQNANELKLLQFPELRSLTLQALSKFIGFYRISSKRGPRILFDKEVVVSKLERMELSAIQIDQIWIDQSSPFQNLIHLDVNGCWNLKYLLPFSMAKGLKNLQSLFVSECEKMEHIFPQGQDSDVKMKDSIFPNLKNIKLCGMKRLSEICNSEVPIDSFGRLETLIIDECDKLVNIFSCYMVGIFRRLSSLKVTNCKSMKAIFDLADKKRDAKYVTNIQDVHLETLPKLEHVLIWKKGQRGILNLNNLQKISIGDCGRLENMFPVSVAKNLENLEHLVVWDCARLREIVAKGEEAKNNSSNPITLVFPRLTTIKFLKLPNFKSFYPGDYKLSCPALNDLSVELCDELEPFREEIADAQRKPIPFPEEVINKLKSMQIEPQHTKSSTSYDYRRDNLEELHLSRLKNTDILYSFLHSNPHLKSLWLNNCFFEVLVPPGRPPEIESLGVVPTLRSLKLTDLPNLKKIGFERDATLQRIELLILNYCHRLEIIAPSSVSLTHLTNLEVVDCEGLKYLMPPSTAKSLGQLSTMKVINCASLMEIVSAQGREEENAGKVDIVFKKLKSLELVSLKKLKSFCSSKNCAFQLPSLEKFVVSACPKMESFSQEVKSTPILQNIYVVHEKEKNRWFWEGNLQATIQYMFKNKKFFEGMDKLSVSEHLDLQQVWQSKEGLQKDWFYSLKTLKLENCKFESYAIPSNVLRRLKSIKELEVRRCNNITVIFEMNDTKIWGTFQLRTLTLEELPKVTHVWQKDEQRIPGFRNLQEVTVTYCQKLKVLFPAALAKDLKMLEKLDVRDCDELLEIVEKEEVAAEGTEKFVFPRLTFLILYSLPHLTHFYSEKEYPELNILTVVGCNELKLFKSQQEEHPESQGSTSIIKQPLFSDIKGISKLVSLCLNWKDTSVLRSWLGQPTDQQGLQYLYVLGLFFDDDDDVIENSALLFEMLEKTPNLETMVIAHCRIPKEISSDASKKRVPKEISSDASKKRSLKEIFLSQNVKMGYGMLGNLKQLFLYRLFEMDSTSGLEHLPKLQELIVCECTRLTTLEQSCSNLKKLHILKCGELQCLFTSSAAKKLINLEEVYVGDCKSMKEIVGNEIATEEIKFERLENIGLEYLPSLEQFYSGNATLQLPSLIQVDMWLCSKMKIFSPGLIHVESSKRIQVSYNPHDDLVFHHDLNVAVVWQLLRQRRLVLRDYPALKGIWLGKVPMPDVWSSCKLKYLEVERCEFLSNAILPSHLLPFLSNLEELVVRKCDFVEAIFDVKDTTTHDSNMIVIPLKRLILDQLPTVRHVWNKDPKGSLSLPFLEEVTVNECKSIKCLFPASVVKDNPRKLDVRNCAELEEIVAKDEAATEEANTEVIMFSRLTSLTLWDLPKLRCICPGMQILDWPVLEDLDVYHCQKMKIFATDFQTSQYLYPKGEDRFTTNKHGFISAEKIPPHLEQLSLNKEDLVMIEQGQVHVDLQKIKTLRLHSFNDESDAFPDVSFEKVGLGSIEKFVVADGAFKELFPSQWPDINYSRIFSELKGLGLKSLHKLESIGLEHTLMVPLAENLELLAVLECTCLTSLAPSTVYFSHLTVLDVVDCARLEYLFTSSTAKTLAALDEMYISNCESLETVVAEEKEGHKPYDRVTFPKLTALYLSKLPKLGSFYTGNSTLKFPSLHYVGITQCKSMKTFSYNCEVPQELMWDIDGNQGYGDPVRQTNMKLLPAERSLLSLH